jgi:hypothetical protein
VLGTRRLIRSTNPAWQPIRTCRRAGAGRARRPRAGRDRTHAVDLGSAALRKRLMPTGPRLTRRSASRRRTSPAALHLRASAARSGKASLLSRSEATTRCACFGEDLAPARRIELGDDADNLRLAPRTGLLIVGFGGGGLGLIDPVSAPRWRKSDSPPNPRASRSTRDRPNLRRCLQCPADRRRRPGGAPHHRHLAIALGRQLPMALDPTSSLLAVAFRSPPVLALLDYNGSAVRSKTATCDDADLGFISADSLGDACLLGSGAF